MMKFIKKRRGGMKISCNSIFRSVSAALSPSAVAPWPQLRSAFDQWLTAELDRLRHHPDHPYPSAAAWLAKALDVAIAAQKSAARSLRSACAGSLRAKDLDRCLDVSVELLDACAVAKHKMDAVRSCVGSLAVLLRRLEGGRWGPRACAELECWCAGFDRSGLRIKADGRAAVAPYSDVHEAVGGSQSVAVLFVAMVDAAVSFKTRRFAACGSNAWSTTGWMDSLREVRKEVFVLEELADTVAVVRRLRRLMTSANAERRREVVGELRRRCGELEESLRPLEERVDVLYRELIEVRMALLGMVTRA